MLGVPRAASGREGDGRTDDFLLLNRSLALRPPEHADRSPTPLRAPPYPQLNRTDLLGGLIHEYEHAA
jgi:hypothetical protein